MKDKSELKKRKEIRSEQIRKLLKMKGYKSPQQYKNYIDEVREKPNQYLDKQFAASSTFRNLMDGKSVKSDNLEEYADDLGVSTDYLLGRSPYIHIDNKEISELTGLSDSAIEKLRIINERSHFDGFLDDLALEANMLLSCLNLILEKSDIREDRPIYSFLTPVSEYLFNKASVRELPYYGDTQILTFEGQYLDEAITVQELYNIKKISEIEDALKALLKIMRSKNDGEH